MSETQPIHSDVAAAVTVTSSEQPQHTQQLQLTGIEYPGRAGTYS